MANNNNNKILNVPNLRFPEFTGEWKKSTLKKNAEFRGGGTPSSSNTEYWNGNIPWISSSDISDNDINSVKVTRYITNEAIENSATKICKAPSVLIVSRVGVGKVAMSNIDLCTSQDFCNLTNINQIPLFMAYLLLRIMKRKANEVQGTSIKGISLNEIKKILISYPNLIEQDKIATLLSIIDQRIATQNKIIEDLKKLMSAIIDLFYTTGNQCCKLSDLIIQTSERNNGKTNNAVLSVSNKNGFVIQKELFEDRIIASDDTSNYKIVQLNDFAYNPARINVGSIARLSEYNEGIVSPMYICFKTNKLVLSEFLEHFFKTRYFYQEMIKRLEGSVRLCLSYESLCDISMPLPSIETQNKIQKRINTILSKINIETCVLKNLELEKSFLLQQMFI